MWLTANPTHPDAEEVQEHISVFENVVCDAVRPEWNGRATFPPLALSDAERFSLPFRAQYPTSAKYYQSLFDGFGGTIKCRNRKLAPGCTARNEMRKVSSLLCYNLNLSQSRPPAPVQRRSRSTTSSVLSLKRCTGPATPFVSAWGFPRPSRPSPPQTKTEPIYKSRKATRGPI